MLRAGLSVWMALLVTSAVWALPPDADLERERQDLERESGELKAQAARLSQQGFALKNQEKEVLEKKKGLDDAGQKLLEERQYLESMGNALAQASAAIDRAKADSYEVTVLGQTRTYGPSPDEINRRVNAYNQALQIYRQRMAAYNQALPQYKNLADSIRASVDRLSAGYEDHRAGVASYNQRATNLRKSAERHTIKVKEAMAQVNKPVPTTPTPKPSGQTGDSSKRIIFDDTVPGKHVK